MKLATLEGSEPRELYEWMRSAVNTGNPVEFHVVGQGWAFRCKGIKEFFIPAYEQM